MVSSYTAEGAAAAIREGNLPDMLSFGIGFSEAAESCLKINGRSFAGGLVGKECRAVPWCRGGYALFCLEDGFEDAGAANTVVSLGGSNQPLAAAALLPLTGNIAAEESTSAYVPKIFLRYQNKLDKKSESYDIIMDILQDLERRSS